MVDTTAARRCLHRRICIGAVAKQTAEKPSVQCACGFPGSNKIRAPYPYNQSGSGRIYVVVRRSASTGSTICCNEISKIMPPTQIIIDTDPGVDDALAFLLALASPEVSSSPDHHPGQCDAGKSHPQCAYRPRNSVAQAYSGGAAVCALVQPLPPRQMCTANSLSGNSRLADPKARWCPNMRGLSDQARSDS